MSRRKQEARLARLRLKAGNGQATLKEIDMLARLLAESKGRNGYTGESRGSTSGTPGPPAFSKEGYNYFKGGVAKEDGVFTCVDTGEITKDCPIAKVPNILINAQVWDCWMRICDEVDTEWIAHLKGAMGKDSKGEAAYIIDNFYFPPQTASGTHVDVPTGVRPRAGVIGAVHSHVGMGVFFSATDIAHSNWPVEIVINRKREYEAVARHKLRCGEWAKNKTKVYLTGSSLPEGILKAVNKAFDDGAKLDKANKRGSKTPLGVALGVAEEDRDDSAEIAEATVDITGVGSSSYNFPPICPITGCDLPKGHTTLHRPYGGGAYFSHTPCSEAKCIRENGHPGWHRDEGNSYWDVPSVKVEGKPKPKEEGKQLPLLVAPSEPDPTEQVDDLEEYGSECYCIPCEGTGTIIEIKDNKDELTTCSTCNGDGLTELGRVRKIEDMAKSRIC